MADALLRAPTAEELAAGLRGGASRQRVEASYTPRHQRFRVKKKAFTQQYSHVYTKRLWAMRQQLRQRAVAATGGEVHVVDKIMELQEGVRSVIIGTTYKNMKLKPSVLDEFSEERALGAPIVPAENITSDDDTIVLEDDTGRARLVGPAAHPHTMVTGVTIAALGALDARGEFHLEQYLPLGLLPHPAAGIVADPPTYVLIASGLEIGGPASSQFPAMLLGDYLGGRLGGAADAELASRVCRVVLAGNCVSAPDPSVLAERHLSQAQQRQLAEPLELFDVTVTQILSSVACDIMPGKNDPANFTLPQQPLHPCLLPNASRFNTLSCVTNPYEAFIGGRAFVGSSGQPVESMLQQTRAPDGPGAQEDASLRALHCMLEWGHLAPTAPDTLPCYPFYEEDPFVMDSCPHVLFAGNQPSFATKVVQGPAGQAVRLVSVPRFSLRGEVVLVELSSLECTLLSVAGPSPAERVAEGL